MIDAVTFANNYHAFWNEHAPTCEHFVRKINIGGFERAGFPINIEGKNHHSYSLIAEMGFSIFVERHNDYCQGNSRKNSEIMEAAWVETERRLSRFLEVGMSLTKKLVSTHMEEILKISDSIFRMYGGSHDVSTRPSFKGCGYIDESEGDLIDSDCLIEIKSVNRKMRGTDVRQLITYCALNELSKQYEICEIGIFNPRSGLFFSMPINEVCLEISGRSKIELFGEIVRAISSGGISR